MKKTLSKSKLIGKGSYGCVFRPGIYCKNKKKKINKKTISKIMIKNTQKAIKKEFKIDKLIKKIPNHNQWSYIWTKMCKPPDYDKMKEISEIQKCLKKSDKTKEEYNKLAYMLTGEYGGIPFNDHCIKFIKRSSYQSLKEFDKIFMKVFRYLEPLFIGLIELKKNNILHHDLSISNVMFKKNQTYIIDFGLSCKYSDNECIKKRSKRQMNGTRIYDPYPYDYIFLYGTKQQRDEEIKVINHEIYRDNHDDYCRIHKDIFNRNDIDENMIESLKYPSKNKKKIIDGLDIYSLGMILPTIICDLSDKYDIKKKQLMKCFSQVKIQNQLSLLKDMTEYHSKNRIDIESAYERYKTLV